MQIQSQGRSSDDDPTDIEETLNCPICDSPSPRRGSRNNKPRFRCPRCECWFSPPFDSRKSAAGKGGRDGLGGDQG